MVSNITPGFRIPLGSRAAFRRCIARSMAKEPPETSAEALFRRAARLSAVELTAPGRVIGRNTQGVRLFDIDEGDTVVSFAKLVEREDEKEAIPEKSVPEQSDSEDTSAS